MPKALGHTVTIRPWLSKVIEAQRPGSSTPRLFVVWTRFLPSGPDCVYVSVIHESPWMFDLPFVAMKGFCGTAVEASFLAVQAFPVKAGRFESGVSFWIGVTVAPAAAGIAAVATAKTAAAMLLRFT